MEKKHRVGSVAFILFLVCIVGSIAASFSLREILPHLNKWQKGGYAIVGGIFIAMAAVILNEMLSFFQND
jgi:hypothetical protein